MFILSHTLSALNHKCYRLGKIPLKNKEVLKKKKIRNLG